MENQVKFYLFLIAIIVAVAGCDKTDTGSVKDEIVYQEINQEYVLIRDVSLLRQKTDPVSSYVDSILRGLISTEYISSGQQKIRLDSDGIFDISFEIVDLNKFNPQGLPEYFDTLAASVKPITVEILDNTTWGYPDALSGGDQISNKGYWQDKGGVLGTFMNAGRFQGQGDKYLGFRFYKNDEYQYGWIKINCSQHNDTLKIIEYAYNKKVNGFIRAGQKL